MKFEVFLRMDILHKRILYPPGCSAKHLCTDCLYFAAPCLGTQELLFFNFCHFCTESILRSQRHLTLHSHRDFSYLRHLAIIKIIIMMMQCCPTDQLTRLNKMQIKSPLRRHCCCISTQKAGAHIVQYPNVRCSTFHLITHELLGNCLKTILYFGPICCLITISIDAQKRTQICLLLFCVSPKCCVWCCKTRGRK